MATKFVPDTNFPYRSYRYRPKLNVSFWVLPKSAMGRTRSSRPADGKCWPLRHNDCPADRLNPPVRLLAAIIALAVSFPAWADFTGKVVAVADGDSITVLRDLEQVKVRLVDIDAPERAQPFGTRSRRALSALVHGQEVLVVERGIDRYQRILGRVYRGDLDVIAEQIRQGMAWVFRRYTKDASLYAIEAEAREQKRGLWRDANPVPPWEWRKDRHKV